MSSTASKVQDLLELVVTHRTTSPTSDGRGDGTSSSAALPSSEQVLNLLSTRFKAELPYAYLGAQHLIATNPERVLEDLNERWAERYMRASAAPWQQDASQHQGDDREHESGSTPDPNHDLPPHPYEFAARLLGALHARGTSQAIVFNGQTGSGKSFTTRLILSQLLRIATSTATTASSYLPSSPTTPTIKRVPKLVAQIHAAQTVLDAFGSCKTSNNANATRQNTIIELHYARATSSSANADRTEAEVAVDPLLLSGAKLLTFGLDKSRLVAPLPKQERTYHVFYQILAGCAAQERESYRLLSDPTEYALLATSGCYTLPGGSATSSVNDSIAYRELRDALDTLGFKPKHVEMIHRLLSAILLLGNLTFADSMREEDQDSVAVSPETRPAFHMICDLLGLTSDAAREELERALVNKTAYIKKEVICTLLTKEGAGKQRDSLMAAIYSILTSFIVESINHKIFPGDDAIKKQQRDSSGCSLIFLDMPGFQTKNPNGPMLNNSSNGSLARSGSLLSRSGSTRRSTLIEAWDDDSHSEFMINYSNELLQHWLNRTAFADGFTETNRQLINDGIKLPEVDLLDSTELTLELMRGGLIGSKADTRPGGMLGGLIKTCSNLKKGKILNDKQADEEWVNGTEERFLHHSRYIGRINRSSILSSGGGGITTGSGTGKKFGIRHYAGTVSYSYRSFVEKDSDLIDSDFVRLFRSSASRDAAASFVAKLFSGPSLAAESHPRDPSVLVSTQVSTRPLRKLSPIKISRNASTSVGNTNELPEFEIEPVSNQINDTLVEIYDSLAEIPIWTVTCLKANSINGSNPNNHSANAHVVFDPRKVREQMDIYNINPLIARRRVDWAQSFEFAEFIHRFKAIGMSSDAAADSSRSSGEVGEDDRRDVPAIDSFLSGQRGFEKGKAYTFGKSQVWLSFPCWRTLEATLRSAHLKETEDRRRRKQVADAQRSLEANAAALEKTERNPHSYGAALGPSVSNDTFVEAGDENLRKDASYGESSDDLLKNAERAGGVVAGANAAGYPVATLPYDDTQEYGRPDPAFARHQSGLSFSPSMAGQPLPGNASDVWGPDWKGGNDGLGPASPAFPGEKGGSDGGRGAPNSNGNGQGGRQGEKDGTEHQHGTVEEVPTSRARRLWLMLVWTLTWWIPSAFLKWFGRMKRPDVRIAWREKVALCILVFLTCGTLLFLMLGLGKVLCPRFDHAWNIKELGYHQGKNDVWVGVAGQAYDITKFYKAQHSDIPGLDVTTEDMLSLAGQDLTPYFPVPLTLGCPDFVTNRNVFLQAANFTPEVPTAYHYSGQQQSVATSALHNQDWYTATFMPKMEKYHKGPIVYTMKDLNKGYEDDGRIWAMYNKRVYDLSDYVYTIAQTNDENTYRFLPTSVTDIFQQMPGQDITKAIDEIDPKTLSDEQKAQVFYCLDNVFYRGDFDFRTTPRCTFAGYFLLAFTIILLVTIGAKFLAALQLTKKRNPELQDKFVICQVPCYTEGEESLRKTIDSLANLKYDDKRKLLFVICDGMIVGSGNDRPTPRIVLDILGVENLDPDPLLFKSLGVGNKQLNYGKVYSGLYEFEGHVLPYIVVVKVGKPSERSKPGNRGKRDSQILLMRFLNRVHFDAEMSPLELEIYHQIKNVIGVDPQLYEYLFTVDADTEVMPDSLNRLVAVAADDSSIIGLCGETKLSNEQESWWTMIQVYEYFISHHMAKAFESLFGSVTCLPGCFTLFRLRTSDKGRPLLISNMVIDDYAENDVDTLHKKNLLHLGEDRYLTTLILKHFPRFKTKFSGDARAMTSAPETWNVLLSQRRRWINSTVHNLFELVTLQNLCGFCCFSMRFVVMIDLLGTILLPATTVYLVYLIVSVATHSGTIPLFSLIMLAAVYGLQVIIFLLKRQWQFIGWLVIYLLAFPVYAFFFPIYSFWHFDDFSWGNTRLVVGEGKNKKILAGDDDHFDDSMIPMRRFADYQAQAWDTHLKPPSRHSPQASEAGFSYMRAPRMPPQHSPHGSFGMVPEYNTQASRPVTMMSGFPAGPQPAFSPFHQQAPGGHYSPAGSVAGSDIGGYRPPMGHAQMRSSQMSFGGFLPPSSSIGLAGPQFNNYAPSIAARNSTYSMANWAMPQHGSMSTINPFADPAAAAAAKPAAADPANPTDAELVTALRNYLRAQDLLQVTKRTTREAMAQQFPQADLTARKAFINQSIDAILQGQI